MVHLPAPRFRICGLPFLLHGAGAILLAASSAHAADATWVGSGVIGSWNDVDNWELASAPGSIGTTNSPDVAIFNQFTYGDGGGAGNPVLIDNGRNIAGINFDLDAISYFIGRNGPPFLLLSSGGAVQMLATLQTAGVTETINAGLQIQGTNGTYTFSNNAGPGRVLVIGGDVSGSGGGATVLTLRGGNAGGNVVSGRISDGSASSVGLTKSDGGTWKLTGENTYTGPTIVNGGTLVLDNANTVGSAVIGSTSSITVTNATLRLTGTKRNALNAPTQLTVNAGGIVDAANSSGTNSHTLGNTTLLGGTLTSSAPADPFYGHYVLDNGATLTAGGDVTSTINAAALQLGTSSSINVSTSGSQLNISSAIQNVGGAIAAALTKTGPGTLTLSGTLSGTSTYTGATTISGGTLSVSSVGNGGASGTLGASSSGQGNLVLDGGTLRFTGGIEVTNRGFTISGGKTGTIDVSSSANLTFSGGSAATSGSLTKSGSGTLTLSGASNHTGTTTVNAGALILQGGAAIADTGGLNLTGIGTSATFNQSETIGSLAGVSGSSVQLNSSTLTSGGNGASTTFGGTISGNGGSLTKLGGGTFTLSGSNSFTGVTTISTGTLSVATIGNGGANGNLGAASSAQSNLVLDGGTLQYIGASASTDRGFTIPFGKTGTFDVSGSANLTITGSSAATNGALTKVGTGTLTLAGNNQHAGTTSVSAGTLALSGGSALADSAALSLASTGVVAKFVNSETIGSLDGVSLSTVDLQSSTVTTGGNGASTTFAGTILGAGSLTKAGGGTFTLTGNSSYTGATTISGGIVSVSAIRSAGLVGNLGAASSAPSNLVLDGGTLLFTGASETTNRGFTIPSGKTGTIDVSGSVSLAFTGGSAATSGALTKNGSGVLLLGGSSNHTGTTTVNAGKLVLSQGAAIADSGAVDLAGSGSLLEINNSETIGSLAGVSGSTVTMNAVTLTTGGNNASTSFAGSIGGFGSALTKLGTGTFTLGGTNNYTGPTNVNAGTLVISGSISGGVIVSNLGSTFAGTGTVGSVSVGLDAVLQGGNGSPSGTLTATGAVSLGDGAVIRLTLGVGGAHSAIAAGSWTLDSNQAFSFTGTATPGATYTNLLTGLNGSEPALATINTWTITTPGVSGVFSYNGAGGINLAVAPVPEPSAIMLIVAGLPLLRARRRA